ncbi:MAG: tetratricopeptide repeat protein [Rhodanobacteraceae bacterium]
MSALTRSASNRFMTPPHGTCRVMQRSLFLLVFWLIAATPTMADNRAPYVPTSPDVVLEHVPSSTDPRVRHFDQLQAELRRNPGDMQRALKLADAYIDYARSTGDVRYLGRALAVIEPWMRRKSVPVPVLLTHATILQSRHSFEDARKELTAILARDPGNVQAWLTLATVALVQGDYAIANDSCVHLATISGNFMGMLCTAQLRSIDGHAKQAYALLGFIENPGPEAPATIKAYIEGLLADTAMHLGKPDEAETHFKAALQWTPGDNFLLADYADFLLDQNRPHDAIALVKDYTQSDTSFLRLVMAESALHNPRAPADIAQMQARFAAMEQRGSHVFQREQAIFELHLMHDPARALALAQENWSVQRAPQDMRIILESALAAGKPHAAQPVLDLIRQSHLQDPRVDRLVEQVTAALTKTGATAQTAQTAQTAARP